MKLITNEKLDHYYEGRSAFSDAWLRVYEPGNAEIPYVVILTELPDRSPSIADDIRTIAVEIMRQLPDPGRGALVVEHHILPEPDAESFDFVRFSGPSIILEGVASLPVTILRRERPRVGIFVRTLETARACRVVVRQRVDKAMIEQLVGQRL